MTSPSTAASDRPVGVSRRIVTGLAMAAAILAAAACGDTFRTPVAASPAPIPDQLLPDDPGHPLAGYYDVGLELGPACGAIPERERNRTYAASVRFVAARRQYVVSLDTGTFLRGDICSGGHPDGLGCHQFVAGDDLDAAWFTLRNEDEWHGGQIVERLASGEWMEVTGTAYGRFDGRRIDAAGQARVWYCPLAAGYPFPCRSYVSCEASLRLTFQRR